MPRIGLWLACGYVVFVAGTAHAQHPLCSPPTPEDSYYYTCRPGTSELVANFLYDLSVRHLFKSGDGFEVKTDKIFEVLDLQKIFEPANPDVKALLKERPAIHFTPLDRTTGEFLSKGVRPGSQTLTVTNAQLGITLDLTIPETVQGLYWRSPAHLDLQFYKGHGIHFRLSGKSGPEFEESLQCVSITASRARATTGDPTHRYLMSFFERCP